MMFFRKERRSKHSFYLSVVVIFYNMRREAVRTLFSISPRYQQNVDKEIYEVIAIDNGSTAPLDQDLVKSFGDNFKYLYLNANTPSPSKAINCGVQVSTGKFVTICIDGARILSPNILNYSITASKLFENPFMYTIGMHIGHKRQNLLVEENYTKEDEDKLVASTNWEEDGYSLFEISSIAKSSGGGFFSKLKESNCFTLSRLAYQKTGGFEEKFTSPGGGYVNLDFFNRVHEIENISPVMLLGEATFHQYHGGVATNVTPKNHPWKQMREEYKKIRGKGYQPFVKKPYYFGTVHARCASLLNYAANEDWE